MKVFKSITELDLWVESILANKLITDILTNKFIHGETIEDNIWNRNYPGFLFTNTYRYDKTNIGTLEHVRILDAKELLRCWVLVLSYYHDLTLNEMTDVIKCYLAIIYTLFITMEKSYGTKRCKLDLIRYNIYLRYDNDYECSLEMTGVNIRVAISTHTKCVLAPRNITFSIADCARNKAPSNMTSSDILNYKCIHYDDNPTWSLNEFFAFIKDKLNT